MIRVETHHPTDDLQRDAKNEAQPDLVELQDPTGEITIERHERDDIV